jgi:hypothetical protein
MKRIKINSRIKAGLERAKVKGAQLGRRSRITDDQIYRMRCGRMVQISLNPFPPIRKL